MTFVANGKKQDVIFIIVKWSVTFTVVSTTAVIFLVYYNDIIADSERSDYRFNNTVSIKLKKILKNVSLFITVIAS